MKKEPQVYIHDILECIDYVESYTKGITLEDFYENTEKQDAVIRRLEVIGEASTQIDSSFKEMHDQIPWRKMTGMRNILIHGYSGVSLETVWNVLQKEIPLLKKKLDKLSF